MLLDPLRPYRWALVAAVVVALITWGGYERIQVATAEQATSTCKVSLATEKQGRADERAAAATAAASQSESYRAEEHRRVAAQQEIADEAERQLTRARADAALADAAAGRLQQRVAGLVAAARAAARDSSPAAGGPPADDPIGVLADLQRRADDRAGVLAAIADERGAAGSACERAYDALTGTAP